MISGRREAEGMVWMIGCDHCDVSQKITSRIDMDNLARADYYRNYLPSGWVNTYAKDHYKCFCSWACASAECAAQALA